MRTLTGVVSNLMFGCGAIIAVIGAVGVVVNLLALADPVAAQAANDADPFGMPPSRTSIATQGGIYLLASLTGGWIALRSHRLARAAQQAVQGDGPASGGASLATLGAP